MIVPYTPAWTTKQSQTLYLKKKKVEVFSLPTGTVSFRVSSSNPHSSLSSLLCLINHKFDVTLCLFIVGIGAMLLEGLHILKWKPEIIDSILVVF